VGTEGDVLVEDCRISKRRRKDGYVGCQDCADATVAEAELRSTAV
jgi:hypothetical protein